MRGETVDIAILPHGRYVEARLSGQLSAQTVTAARRCLVALLREWGCVVADLSGLQLRDPGCVAVFSAALEQAGGWPHVRLAVFGVGPAVLAQLRCPVVRGAVPVADGLDTALAAAARPPGPDMPTHIAPADGPRSGVAGTTAVTDKHGLAQVLVVIERNGGLARFVRDWLGVLLDHDVRNDSELIRTLSVFLDRDGDYNGTSVALGIHRSTVRYRIQRVRELTGLDLGDAGIRLNLHAATRALAYLPGPP